MKTTETKIVLIESIADYDNLYGIESPYPLVAVIDLKKATKIVNHIRMDYGIYALYLKNDANCTINYRRKSYDYQAGTVVSFSPGSLSNSSLVPTLIPMSWVSLKRL